MDSHPFALLGISGSLRRGSYNSATLDAVAELCPDHVRFARARIDDLPHYDDDIRAVDGSPGAAARLRREVAAADAIVVATPEYNYSVPGVLKNALDWASRAPDQPFAGKPVLIMSASTSLLGGVRAQYHLRQILVFLDACPLNRPEIFISHAATKFAQGRLIDPTARQLIGDGVLQLLALSARLRGNIATPRDLASDCS